SIRPCGRAVRAEFETVNGRRAERPAVFSVARRHACTSSHPSCAPAAFSLRQPLAMIRPKDG
ncbi:MAG: hypothetical protein ORN49_05080, partial [Rhodobacteraceae bacterium]|nr:hypothetical protein [Paracoccaceae bacterium]